MVFCFVGKSGVEHTVTIDDPATVQALEVMRRRRGRAEDQLLAWKERGRWRGLDSGLVNDYVRETTGMEATAKDFRTWHATVIAAAALAESPEPGNTKASRKRAVAATMREVAEYLGNTPALARSSYVDPRVVDAYEEGRTIARAVRRKVGTPDQRQAVLERAVLRLLREA
jgi:DNA topoisomerase IB